jgi:capsular polysaccharide biosynthesis protein
MELRDYIAALRRHRPTWLGLTVVGLILALVVVQLTPHTYRATAQVFVSSSTEGSPQFVAQRVKSYPDVAVSAAVLVPAAEHLGLDTGVAQLRDQVTASNPVDTSQINIVATAGDPDSAADIANAVAKQFTTVVARLEQPGTGTSPVALTVTNPATAPTAPSSPQPTTVMLLGLLVGLFLGLAAAIVRSRIDPRLHDEPAVRAAWGAEDLVVLAEPEGRTARKAMGARPADTLARRLELLAEAGKIRITMISAAPADQQAAESLAQHVAASLVTRDLVGLVAGPADGTGGGSAVSPQVQIDIGDALAPLRRWREVAATSDGVVVVLPRGRVTAAGLREVRSVLTDAGISPLAVVIARASRSRRRHPSPTQPGSDSTSQHRPAPPVEVAGPGRLRVNR